MSTSPRTSAESGAENPEQSAGERAAANDRAMMRAVRRAVLAGLALDALVVLAAALIGGRPALLGALIGTGLSLVVTLPTLATARWGARGGVAGMAAVVMGAWLAKMVVLIGVLVWVRTLAGISLPWIGIALLLGAVGAAVLEAVLLLRGQPRLEVRPGPEGP